MTIIVKFFMNKENISNDQQIKALELKSAVMRGLSILGLAAVESLVEELKRGGIDLDSYTKTYSLADTERMLVVIFGDEVVPLMMKKIHDQLKQ